MVGFVILGWYSAQYMESILQESIIPHCSSRTAFVSKAKATHYERPRATE